MSEPRGSTETSSGVSPCLAHMSCTLHRDSQGKAAWDAASSGSSLQLLPFSRPSTGSCKARQGEGSPYQNALPWLQAPEGTLRVDLVCELPLHEHTLAAPLQHCHADCAAADIHRHLERQREKHRKVPAPFPAALLGAWGQEHSLRMREREEPSACTDGGWESHCHLGANSSEVKGNLSGEQQAAPPCRDSHRHFSVPQFPFLDNQLRDWVPTCCAPQLCLAPKPRHSQHQVPCMHRDVCVPPPAAVIQVTLLRPAVR